MSAPGGGDEPRPLKLLAAVVAIAVLASGPADARRHRHHGYAHCGRGMILIRREGRCVGRHSRAAERALYRDEPRRVAREAPAPPPPKRGDRLPIAPTAPPVDLPGAPSVMGKPPGRWWWL